MAARLGAFVRDGPVSDDPAGEQRGNDMECPESQSVLGAGREVQGASAQGGFTRRVWRARGAREPRFRSLDDRGGKELPRGSSSRSAIF